MVMLGLISFVAVVLFLCEILALGAAGLKCGAELEEPPIYVALARQRGGNTSHTPEGGRAVGVCLWELSGAPVWTIWSLRAPASTGGMQSFVMVLRLIAFKFFSFNVGLRSYYTQDTNNGLFSP